MSNLAHIHTSQIASAARCAQAGTRLAGTDRALSARCAR
jgi:hypothetical protein